MNTKPDKNTVYELIQHIKHFDAESIKDGDNSTEENRVINSYADGVVRGYKDAVNQILQFLHDYMIDL